MIIEDRAIGATSGTSVAGRIGEMGSVSPAVTTGDMMEGGPKAREDGDTGSVAAVVKMDATPREGGTSEIARGGETGSV